MSSENNVAEQAFLELRQELIVDTVASRLKLLILAETIDKRRFPTLEKLTGVNENTWRTWWNRGGIPGGILLAAAGRAWPEYAFWLITGITDVEYGHRMPKLHDSVKGYVSNWPEGNLKKDRLYAAEYFKVCKEMQDLTSHKREPQTRTASQQSEILNNTREFVRKKRFEEISKGVNWSEWTHDEE